MKCGISIHVPWRVQSNNFSDPHVKNKNSFNLLWSIVTYLRCLVHTTDVNLLTLLTREPSGFYSVQSTLEYKVIKEDKDAYFSCEVSFFVPTAIRTVESNSINITVHCESSLFIFPSCRPQPLTITADICITSNCIKLHLPLSFYVTNSTSVFHCVFHIPPVIPLHV